MEILVYFNERKNVTNKMNELLKQRPYTHINLNTLHTLSVHQKNGINEHEKFN